MNRILLLIVVIFTCFSLVRAQGFGYDEKNDLGNGLYKVKSGDSYGIIDTDGNVIVSVEYQDILFRKGKALLTKNNLLYGIVDSLGTIKTFDTKYKVHPQYRYIYEGYIIVGDSKWGYINEYGAPLQIKSKMKGVLSLGKKHPTMFDDATPFMNGFASVYLKKEGWKHIDKEGVEHYKLRNKKSKASFRSAIYKGECIIVTDEGIKQYQEDANLLVVVKRVLSSTASFMDKINNQNSTKLVYKEGTLTLDSLLRVTKYENGTDSIIFIEKPRKVIVKKVTVPVDTLSIEKDLSIELKSKNLQADAKGRALVEVKVKNNSNTKFKELSIVLECSNAVRQWEDDLESNSEISISFYVPARFSAMSIKRNLMVKIKYKNKTVEQEYPITIKRYAPVRSR